MVAPRMPSRPTRMRETKSSALKRGESLVEGEHQCAVEAGRGEQAQLRARVGEAKHRIGRAQHIARVRLERHGDRRAAERRRARDRRIDHGAMAAMHAVEIADRRDRRP